MRVPLRMSTDAKICIAMIAVTAAAGGIFAAKLAASTAHVVGAVIASAFLPFLG